MQQGNLTVCNTDGLTEYMLRLGDSSLILGHRVSEWCGHGPMLEEDIAMANVGLDLLGAARLLLTEAGSRMQPVQSEDQLAYFRDEAQFKNFTLCELPNSGIGKGQHTGDYAFTIAKNLCYASFMALLWDKLAAHTDTALAGIAAKAVKEARYHATHGRGWAIRFGDGTADSHARMQAAIDAVWPCTNEFFFDDAVTANANIAHAGLKPQWLAMMQNTLDEATLRMPQDTKVTPTGRLGQHSEHLGFLLAEMQILARQHPQATW